MFEILLYLFKTFKYNRVYIPLPGPPAEKLPPPPIREFKTQNGMKSLSLYEQLSKPKTKWAKSGKGFMDMLTLLRSFSTLIKIHTLQPQWFAAGNTVA